MKIVEEENEKFFGQNININENMPTMNYCTQKPNLKNIFPCLIECRMVEKIGELA